MPRFTGDTIELTNAIVKTLEVPEGKKDKLWFDTKQRGFFIRKFESGKATYGVKYTCKGRQRRIKLGPALPGNLDKMRALASEAVAKATLGIDMAANAKAEAKAKRKATLGDLLPTYLEIREKGSPDKLWKKLRPNSLSDVVRYLKRAWHPFHALTPEAVTRQMVVDRMTEITAGSGPIASKRAHAALSTYFAWLIHNNHSSAANPTMGIKLAKEEPRSRALKEPELIEVWLAADEIGGDFGTIVKLLILTGQRLREIGNLEWSEINLERRLIELPERRTKNGKAHQVPLSAPALALLRGIPRHEGQRLVFLGCRGSGMTTYSRHKANLDKRIAERRGSPLPPWRLHDLRRSAVTQLSESRERRVKRGHLEEIETFCFAQPHVVEAIVNHISGAKSGVAGVYDRSTNMAGKRQALDQWAAHFMGLVERHMTTVHGAPAENLMTAAPSGAA
jgi:integrase